ncbi:hypothetical protein [Rahnella bruchi]|uniref:hypothetical protein n=1 Tax=Rahnella bruchi TaxID=1510573 RepID=UPI000EA356E6|nr:hypothetical protein [Rahnella bruchi]
MSYTHILVQMKSAEKTKPVLHLEADLDENFVVEHIIKPYIGGERIFIDGSRAEACDIAKISVFESEQTSQELLDEENMKIQSSTTRARANRIFTGNAGKATRLMAIKGASSQNVTRKLFNQAMGIS